MRRVAAALGWLLVACSPGDQGNSSKPSVPASPAAVVQNAAAAPRLINASMAYDIARKQLVIFGSWYSLNGFPTGMPLPASPSAETWTLQNGKWTKLAPATSPPSRTWAGMAYDESRREIVLFGGGGFGLPLLGDTWTWNGATWSERRPPTSPPAASAPALVYDAKLGRVIALVDFQEITQTWAWDGKTWARIHPSVELPGPRFMGSAAYDATRGSIVVFGDRANSADTWTFDGQTWARHIPLQGGPPGRQGATMAFDPSEGRVLMFGGTNTDYTPISYRDTWLWDEARWTLASNSNGPWGRNRALAVSDTTVGQVVLYGGSVGAQSVGVSYSDVWTWAHGSWTLVQPTSIPSPPDERDAILQGASLGPGLRPICGGSPPPCMSVRGQARLGFYAAYVTFDLNPAEGSNAMCISYLSYVNGNVSLLYSSGPWHQVGVVCGPADAHVLQLGAQAKVAIKGCANVRTFPRVGAVVTCVPNGTLVRIDDGPFAVAGELNRLWWHLEQRGWMAHELLAAA